MGVATGIFYSGVWNFPDPAEMGREAGALGLKKQTSRLLGTTEFPNWGPCALEPDQTGRGALRLCKDRCTALAQVAPRPRLPRDCARN